MATAAVVVVGAAAHRTGWGEGGGIRRARSTAPVVRPARKPATATLVFFQKEKTKQKNRRKINRRQKRKPHNHTRAFPSNCPKTSQVKKRNTKINFTNIFSPVLFFLFVCFFLNSPTLLVPCYGVCLFPLNLSFVPGSAGYVLAARRPG